MSYQSAKKVRQLAKPGQEPTSKSRTPVLGHVMSGLGDPSPSPGPGPRLAGRCIGDTHGNMPVVGAVEQKSEYFGFLFFFLRGWLVRISLG